MLMKHFFQYAISLLIGVSSPALAGVWYVDKDALPGGDGTSWSAAYTEIQPAIDAAFADGGGEVWVAKGVYNEIRTGSGGSLDLREEVRLYGGFAGDEVERGARDPELNATAIDGTTSWVGDNASITVRGASNTVIDGFVLEGGDIAQIRCAQIHDVEVRQCVFYGGPRETSSSIVVHLVNGFVLGNSRFFAGDSPTLSANESDLNVFGCEFAQNAVPAAFYWVSGVIQDCLFLENLSSAVILGGTPDSLRFERCLFRGNVGWHGGAVWFEELVQMAAPQFINCIFDRNRATYGGAVFLDLECWDRKQVSTEPVSWVRAFPSAEGEGEGEGETSLPCEARRPPSFVNCTFVGNRATYGGAIDVQFGYSDFSQSRIANCIFWDNGEEPLLGTLPPVSYSIVEGGYAGTGNRDLDPRFRDAANGDYRLALDSPAIDWGRDSSTVEFGEVVEDFVGCPRGYDGDGFGQFPFFGDGSDYDIGAYEYAPGCPLPPWRHTADRNENERIDLSELLRLIQFYNYPGYRCADDPSATEDGYLPGAGANQSCTPHNADYSGGPDWTINLTELLRIIQFFNSSGYHPCEGTEDGFCPGST